MAIDFAALSASRKTPFTEGLVDGFCEWYLARLGAGLGIAAAPARRAA